MKLDADLMALQEVRDLLNRAHQAQQVMAKFAQAETDAVVAAMARAAEAQAAELAEMAVAETGFGRVADKILKNRFAATGVLASIAPMKTAGVIRDDPDARLVEIAVPMGVVAGIIPSTNPTSTTIYKALIALKARNGIVFSPHPAAAGCIRRTAELLHEAAVKQGAPEGIIGCITHSSLATTEELMHHRLTSVILATGGHGLVKAAYSSGKPAYGVGPGNVPAFVERTADPEQAVRRILAGTCFDNGTVCASEQAVVVDRPLDEAVRQAFRRQGAYFCTADEALKLAARMVDGGKINPAVVGRSAAAIAGQAGLEVPAETTALIVELSRVGPEEPLSMEKLSPVLAYYTVDGWEEGCEKCMAILAFGGVGHTLVIHSRDRDVVMKFALEKPAFRILANTSGTHGAIGLSTALTPSLTLGCGTFGNNITTDNITATHLINIKRLAYETEPVEFPLPADEGTAKAEPAAAATAAESGAAVCPPVQSPAADPAADEPEVAVDRETIREMVREALQEVGQGLPTATESTRDETRNIWEIHDFVTVSDVQEAAGQGLRIAVTPETRITPLARELGDKLKIFILND